MAVLLSAVGCSRAPATGDPSAAAGDVEALEREAASLKSQLADTRSRIDDLRLELNSGGSTAVTGNLSTPEIIGELLEIKLTSGNRRAVQRRMGYLFESLAGRGDAAVPHIRGFLNKMEDVDFAIPKSPKDEANELEYWRSRMVRVPLDFEYPPSLRIGLIDILSEIGGAQVEEAIAKVLAATGRGFEIAYAANKLRSMIGKDAYCDEAVGAAHELLAEPIHV